jgi:acetyl-CoA acetyltransferase
MPGSVIVGGARTPIGKLSGALKGFSAMDLGGIAIREALARAGVAGDQVDYVIMGHVIQAGAGQITARQAAVKGGIPMSVPALTVNKVCLSGLNAIAMADQLIGYGEFDIVVAGGMESMTNGPYLQPGPAAGTATATRSWSTRPRTTPCSAPSTSWGWAQPPTSTTRRARSAAPNRTSSRRCPTNAPPPRPRTGCSMTRS